MTAAKLAQMVGVSPPTVSEWQSGKIQQISVRNALKICHALDVDLKWLMHGGQELSPSINQPRHDQGALSMNTDELIQYLHDELSNADLEGMDIVKLGKLEGLLYHWQKLTEMQINNRFRAQRDEASE